MNLNANHWDSERTGTIDQRSAIMPDTWVPSKRETEPVPEVTEEGVHQSGPKGAVLDRMYRAIDSAREMVVLTSFLLAEPHLEASLLGAARRGIRVYLLLACETRLDKEVTPDDEFGKQCLDQHLGMLNALAGWAMIRSAPFFHAKALLVDPQNGGQGFLSTANFTTEALARNEELIVELSQAEMQDVFATLRWALWEAAQHEMIGPVRFEAIKPLGEINLPPADGEVRARLGMQDTLTNGVLRVIDEAKSKIVVSSFAWEEQHPVVRALCRQANAGIQVTVLARVRDKAMPALLSLRRAGARVLGFTWLHAKAVWSDGGCGMVLTANFEVPRNGRGFELGLFLREERAAVLINHLNTWTKLAPWRLELAPRLGDLVGNVKVCTNGQFRDIEVKTSKIIQMEDLVAPSAELTDQTTVSAPAVSAVEHPAHIIVYRCRVLAPRLSSSAREIKRPAKKGTPARSYMPPVYRERSGRIVVAVQSKSEISQAVTTKQESGAKAIFVQENPSLK